MANRNYGLAYRAHEISTALDIPFGAAWRVAQCVSKTRFTAEGEALEHADRYGYRTYRCDVCGLWHLTGSPERKER